jgi:sec-independent protein translocase protein TatC
LSLRRLRGAFRRSHRRAKPKLGQTLPLLRHLNELRQRAFRAMLAVLITTAISFAFSVQIIDYLTVPVGGRGALTSIEITENMSIFMRVSLLSGMILGMPAVVYQVLRFVLPGLQGRERVWMILGVPFASLLFAGGVAFTWFIIIPVAIPFLTGFLDIATQPRPSNYFEFITSLMFWIGLSFEMPLVTMILAKLKFVTARQLLGGWRYAVVGIAAAAAAITPTVDPVNMGIVMLPLGALYVISVFLAAVAGRG